MPIFKSSKSPPPSASVATDAIEQTTHVFETAQMEKDQVAETSAIGSTDDIKGGTKKKANANLGNYFVGAQDTSKPSSES
jgi:hypothetical protein